MPRVIARKKLPEMHLDKSTGWWFSLIRDPAVRCGRFKKTWSKNHNEAVKLYNAQIEELVAQRSANKPIAADDPRLWSYKELCTNYYASKQSNGKSPALLGQVHRYLDFFGAFLKARKFRPESTGVESLTSAHLLAYRAQLLANTLISRVEANHRIGFVRGLLSWAQESHGLKRPPMGDFTAFPADSDVKKNHGRHKPERENKVIPADVMAKLWNAADTTDRAMLWLGARAGFGNMDLATLTLAEVDLDNGLITSQRHKTGVDRFAGLNEVAVALLREYLAKHRGKPKAGNEGLFFVTVKGYPLVRTWVSDKGVVHRTDAINQRFRRLCQRAGVTLPWGGGFYLCRHTYATRIGEVTNDPREVQAAMGHASMHMQLTYRHDTKQKALAAQGKVTDEVFGLLEAKTTSQELTAQQGGAAVDDNGATGALAQ